MFRMFPPSIVHAPTVHKLMEENWKTTGAFEFILESLNLAVHTWELSNFIKYTDVGLFASSHGKLS